MGSGLTSWLDRILAKPIRHLFESPKRLLKDHVREGMTVLDVGCGDGHFASVAFSDPLDAGLDPWWGPLMEARHRHSYHTLAQADGARMPYPDSFFASAISNSTAGVILADSRTALRLASK